MVLHLIVHIAYGLCHLLATYAKAHIGIGGILALGCGHHAETHAFHLVAFQFDGHAVLFSFVHHHLASHHHGVLHKAVSFGQFKHKFHAVDILSECLLEVHPCLQCQEVARDDACLVHRERGVLSCVVQFAFIKEGYQHVLYRSNLAGFHTNLVLNVVGTFLQTALLQAVQVVHRVEECALAHAHHRVVSIGQVAYAQHGSVVLVLLHKVALRIVKHCRNTLVLCRSE